MTGTPGRNSKHGETPCAQGARRDPQSARSNVTASQPEKDSSAEVFCRATPVLCAPPTATSIGAHQPREEDPPPLRGQSGDVQAERGARRKPTSARSNMTASGPEQDLVAGTSRRAPPETGVKSTTATVGTRQSREEAPLLPAPVAADQAETAPKTAENRERESSWRRIRASVRERAENQRQQPPERTPFPAVFNSRSTLGRTELSELAGDGGISAETATALVAWVCCNGGTRYKGIRPVRPKKGG